jgi:GT2 family glycosyltransferase
MKKLFRNKARKGFVSVIVLNYNGRKFLGECLHGLGKQTYPNIEVLVVDNGSTDGSADYIRQKFVRKVRLIESRENLGFAGGNNLGMIESTGEFIALLNNDAVPEPGWVSELVKAMTKSSQTGMCASKILLSGDGNLIDNTGHMIALDGMGIGRGRLDTDASQFDSNHEVFSPSGCAALYRRCMLEEIGLFDEDYFLYVDDFELGFRARLAGWECAYAPRAVVHHRFSATAGEELPRKLFYIERNRIWTMLKYYPVPVILLSPAYSISRYFFQAFASRERAGSSASFLEQHGPAEAVRQLANACADAAKSAPAMLSRRAGMKKLRKVPAWKVYSWFLKYGISPRNLSRRV